MLLADGFIHLPGDTAVGEMSLGLRAQFGDVDGLCKIHLEERAVACAEGQEILSRGLGLGRTALREPDAGRMRRLHRFRVTCFESSLFQPLGKIEAVRTRK